jgi:hypothetical protein
MRLKSWAKKMKEEIESIGLVYIWHSRPERDQQLKTIIKERCNYTERQNLFLIMSEKTLLRDKA